MNIKGNSISFIVGIWVAVIALFLLGTYIPRLISPEYMKLLEVTSSWITVVCTLVFGILAAIIVMPYSRSKAILVACAYSSIFICYIGYVTIDYESFEPLASAIGFNIATILQALGIWKVAQILNLKQLGNK